MKLTQFNPSKLLANRFRTAVVGLALILVVASIAYNNRSQFQAADGTSFLETFDGNPPSPQNFDPPNWVITDHEKGREVYDYLGGLAKPPLQGDHGDDCSPPPAQHTIDDYKKGVYICRNHIMTVTGPYPSIYSVIYMTPDHLVDFSNGEATISFDLSTGQNKMRTWFSIDVTPYNEYNQLFLEYWIPDLNGPARDAVHISTREGAMRFVGQEVADYNFLKLAEPAATISQVLAAHGLQSSFTRRDKFEIKLSKTHLKMTMPDLPGGPEVLFDQDFPQPLNFDSGMIQVGTHAYTPWKGFCVDSCDTNTTFHWDNFFVSPAKPFTIIKPDRFWVDARTTDTVNFAKPAPDNALLNFTGISGTADDGMQVSFDGGVNWIVAPMPNQVKGGHGDDLFDSFRLPIPAGTQSVKFKATDWWGARWQARDMFISAAEAAPITRAPIDSTPPTTTITKPVADQTISGTFQVTGTATDASGIKSTELWLDGQRINILSYGDFSFDVNSEGLTDGAHNLYVKAIDNANNTGQSKTINFTVKNASDESPVTTPPSSPPDNPPVSTPTTPNPPVTPNSPIPSTLPALPSTQTVRSTVKDVLTTLTKNVAINFPTKQDEVFICNFTVTGQVNGFASKDIIANTLFIDGTAVASSTGKDFSLPADLSNLASGQHQLSVQSKVGDQTVRATRDFQLVVAPNLGASDVDPTVVINSPTNNQSVTGVVTVTGQVSKAGPVKTVNLLVDGRTVDSASNANFSLALDSSKLTNDLHLLSVRADTTSGAVTSSPINIVVTNKTDKGAFTVNLVEPSTTEVSGLINVKSQINYAGLTKKIKLLIDDGLVVSKDITNQAALTEFSQEVDTHHYVNGPHQLVILAYGRDDSVASFGKDLTFTNQNQSTTDLTLTDQRPVISSVTPNDNQTIAISWLKRFNINANITDDRVVSKVEIEINGVNHNIPVFKSKRTVWTKKCAYQFGFCIKLWNLKTSYDYYDTFQLKTDYSAALLKRGENTVIIRAYDDHGNVTNQVLTLIGQ